LIFFLKFWSAPAERSGDGALGLLLLADAKAIQSAVAAALCRRTPRIPLWLEVAGRICRQLICDYHLRKQVETRLTSIKFK